MNLHEGQEDITNVLREEPEPPGAAGSSAAVNENDFSVQTLEIPAKDQAAPVQEKPATAAEAPAQAAAPASSGEIKKETVKTTIGPNGEKVVEKTIIQQAAPNSEKSEAVARLFNPDTALLMFDIFLTRFGGIFTPERPREYWSLTVQDRKDLGTLAKESAREEGWTGIPTRYLLFGALGLMIGGKVVYAKKTQYKWVPGEKEGDPKAETGSSGEQEKKSSSAASSDRDYQSLFIREKARHEAELGFKNNSDELNELKKQNEYFKRIFEKAEKSKVPGGGISDADYVMLSKDRKERTEERESASSGDFIFTDSQGRDWNLDKVEFSDNEALLDKTKAGLPGWSPTGIKLGHISKGQREAFAEWKQYRKNKRVAA